MQEPGFQRLRIVLTLLVSLAIWILLLWRHFDTGVPAHHLLHNPELPRISDWFGGLLLPVLAWFLLGLTGRRLKAGKATSLLPAVIGLAGGLLVGAAMSASFFTGHESITGYLFFSLLPLALLLPVYRPECLLGFILGMCVGFGGVLPTLFGGLMALATFLIHRFIGLPLQRLVGLNVKPGL